MYGINKAKTSRYLASQAAQIQKEYNMKEIIKVSIICHINNNGAISPPIGRGRLRGGN